MFQNPKCTVISSITAVVVFIIWKFHNRHAVTEKIARRTDIMYHNLLFLSDTLGLAAFTILGMETTIRFLNTDQFLLIAFVGLITGVGGGMFRDVLAGIMPAVLRKHVYACASLVGAICYLGLLCAMPRGYAMFTGAMIVVVIRLLASHYKWNCYPQRLQKLLLKQVMMRNMPVSVCPIDRICASISVMVPWRQPKSTTRHRL